MFQPGVAGTSSFCEELCVRPAPREEAGRTLSLANSLIPAICASFDGERSMRRRRLRCWRSRWEWLAQPFNTVHVFEVGKITKFAQ